MMTESSESRATATAGLGGWLFQGFTQFTKELMDDLRQPVQSEHAPEDNATENNDSSWDPVAAIGRITSSLVGDSDGPHPHQETSVSAVSNPPISPINSASFLPHVPLQGISQFARGAMESSKELMAKATDLTYDLTNEVVTCSKDMMTKAGDFTCDATCQLVEESAALFSMVGETTVQLRQKATETAADLIHSSQQVLCEATALTQEISESLCQLTLDPLVSETCGGPSGMQTAAMGTAPGAQPNEHCSTPGETLAAVGHLTKEVLEGSRMVVTTGAMETLQLTKELFRDSVNVAKEAFDKGRDGVVAVTSLDSIASSIFADSTASESPVLLQGFLAVSKLQAEDFEAAKAAVIGALWKNRPSHCTAEDIEACTAQAGAAIDIRAVQDSAGRTLQDHLHSLADAHPPVLLHDRQADAFRWIGPQEFQGQDYTAYRALRSSLPDDAFYAAAQERVETLVRASCEPKSISDIQKGTCCTPVPNSNGNPIKDFLDQFGVDLGEEYPLLCLLRGRGAGQTEGLTYHSRSGTFCWTHAPFRLFLPEDGGSSDASDILQQLQSHDRQALQGMVPHLGIRSEHIQPLEKFASILSSDQVVVLEQRTGREASLGATGAVVYAKCPAMAQHGTDLAALWQAAYPGSSAPDLRLCVMAVTETEEHDWLDNFDSSVIARVWVRAWHTAAEVLVVDAIACRGGMWKTKLLEFLQLRQLPAVESLGQAGLLQNVGGRWELATDMLMTRMKELCCHLNTEQLAVLRQTLSDAVTSSQHAVCAYP